jgi:hypothetical protein
LWVASGWRAGSWGQCCRVVMEVGEVVGRIGCVAVMVAGNGDVIELQRWWGDECVARVG